MTGSTDSFRNSTRYLGQDYRFAPSYLRKRDPTLPWNLSVDIRPPEQQGYYPIGSLWMNTVNNRVFILVNIVANKADWVLLNVSVTQPALDFIVDASTPPGTNPVVPDVLGNVTITGGQVGPGVVGANVIRTNSLALNTFTVQIQQTSTSAAVNTTLNGVAHFNSAQFTNNQGFISLIGAGAAVEQVTGNDALAVVPTAGNINLLGAVVANSTDPAGIYVKRTAASTETIDVQLATAIVATNVTKVGLAAFNSAQFTVDANGFVSIIGGGAAIESVTGNDGLTVVPTAGNINLLAAVVANGTDPTALYVKRTAGSTETIDVQFAASNAVTLATKAGLASFLSTQFTVDANGFVSASGTGLGQTITGQSGGALSPTAGNWNIFGASTAAGTSPVVTSGAGSTLTVNVQKSQAIAATNATNVGLAAFNNTEFTVDANGFVSLVGGGAAIETITGNSGGPEVPLAGNFNILGTGSITVVGSANTETVQLTGLTNHAVLVGAGTATITNVGPTATVGQVLQSAGAAADPAFSTATYPLTTTINQILFSSATNTVTGLATANRAVLTTGATGVPVLTALAVDGQLIIGSTAGAPAAATLTAGTGITITNGSNSITIAASQAFTWTDVTTATQALAVFNGYFTDRGAGVTYTLPATAALGDIIKIDGKLGLTTIAQNAGQSIRFSSAITTVGVGGSAVGTNVGDCVSLRCSTAGASTVWIAEEFIGNWTIT